MRPGAVGEDRRLEAPELGHPLELGDVAAVGQLAVTRLADQPSMLRPVEAAMEEVVELGAGDGPVLLGEDMCSSSRSSLTTRRRSCRSMTARTTVLHQRWKEGER